MTNISQQITEVGTMNVFVHWINEYGGEFYLCIHSWYCVGALIKQLNESGLYLLMSQVN